MKRHIGILLAVGLLSACADDAPTEDAAQSARQANADTSTSQTARAASDSKTIAASDDPKLAVEAEGLRLFNAQSGAARPIAFGTPREAVIAALAFRGEPGTGTNGECGAGPLQYANWPDGLGLYFQKDKFVGWTLNERTDGAITTASSIGPGSTRAELEAAYAAKISQTTLGTEFAAGELFGLLDGKGTTAKITDMWGGVSCNFR